MATYFREHTDGEGNVYHEYSTSNGTWNAVTKVNCTEAAETTSDITKELATDICKKALGYYSDEEIVTLCAGKGNWVPMIAKVIFHNPATIVFWADGTKTVVKAQTRQSAGPMENPQARWSSKGDCWYVGDDYDPEKGLAMAIAKKALGNQGNYYETFKRWIKSNEAL